MHCAPGGHDGDDEHDRKRQREHDDRESDRREQAAEEHGAGDTDAQAAPSLLRLGGVGAKQMP
jgi:hypothetical protein